MDTVLQTPSKQMPQQRQALGRRPKNKADIMLRLAERGFAEPAVLLSCGVSYHQLRMRNDFTYARAFSRAWTCQPLRKPRVPQVAICHVDGIVLKVYKDLVWFPASLADPTHEPASALLEPNRLSGFVELFRDSPATLWAFSANEAPELMMKLCGMDLSAELTRRGMANPVRYVNCHEVD